MKLQLLCIGAVVLIQSAFVASHEVPSFRGVSLLGDHDAKDAAVAPVKPAETDAPEKKDEIAGRRRGKTWKTDAPEKKDELADETEERRGGRRGGRSRGGRRGGRSRSGRRGRSRSGRRRGSRGSRRYRGSRRFRSRRYRDDLFDVDYDSYDEDEEAVE